MGEGKDLLYRMIDQTNHALSNYRNDLIDKKLWPGIEELANLEMNYNYMQTELYKGKILKISNDKMEHIVNPKDYPEIQPVLAHTQQRISLLRHSYETEKNRLSRKLNLLPIKGFMLNGEKPLLSDTEGIVLIPEGEECYIVEVSDGALRAPKSNLENAIRFVQNQPFEAFMLENYEDLPIEETVLHLVYEKYWSMTFTG